MTITPPTGPSTPPPPPTTAASATPAPLTTTAPSPVPFPDGPLAYLDHAGMGRVRPHAVAAMRTAVEEVYPYGSARMGRIFPARSAARASAARLLECTTAEIALVPNTSTGLHLVADGLRWRDGDEVVVFDREFPANVHPWRAVAERYGVRLVWVPMRDGRYALDDVAAAIGPRTRLIAAGHVNFATGFRLDLDAVCALAAPVGALVCVDAVQGLGTLPFSTARTPVDFVAAGAHKWLGGPAGTGLFYCRAERLPLLRSVPAGWFGFDDANDMLTKGPGHFRYDLTLRAAAARVEGGMYDVLGMVGLAAALEEIEAIGVETISGRIARLTGKLRDGLAGIGCRVVSPGAPQDRSGITGFTVPGCDGGEVARQLVAGDVHVSYPDGVIRVSPHHWTREEEIDTLLAATAKAVATCGRR